MRREWAESFRRRVGGDFVRRAQVVAHVRAYGFTRVGPDASDFADTHAFRYR